MIALMFHSAVGRTLLPFAVLMVLFWVLESLWPEDQAQPRWRKDSLTDLCYWFLGYGVRFFGGIAALIAIVLTARLLPRTGPDLVADQPLWTQTLEILLLGDLIEYWMHRFFHTNRALWPFHAVHHSPEQLDWLAAARVHPLDTIISRMAVMLPLYFLGFSGKGMAPYALFLAVYPIYLHANLSWSYGPFRYLIAGPAFHRWHHSAERAALDKNFSGLFPFIDVLFGTAYFPARRSVRYGLYRQTIPGGVLSQWLYPFRTRRCPGMATDQRPEIDGDLWI